MATCKVDDSTVTGAYCARRQGRGDSGSTPICAMTMSGVCANQRHDLAVSAQYAPVTGRIVDFARRRRRDRRRLGPARRVAERPRASLGGAIAVHDQNALRAMGRSGEPDTRGVAGPPLPRLHGRCAARPPKVCARSSSTCSRGCPTIASRSRPSSADTPRSGRLGVRVRDAAP